MRKIIIKLGCIALLIFTICSEGTISQAAAGELDNYINQAEDFLSKADNELPINETALKDTSTTIFNTLFAIAIAVATIVGMIIGIQFIMGSPTEKAQIKETLVPYAIGVFVVFASFTIWKIVVEIGNAFSTR